MSYLDSPTYSPALAGRLVGLRPERVRRWLEGYHYNYPARTGRPKIIKRKDPLVRREGARESRFASFLDIIELLFVKRFVDHGISIQKVRNALFEVEEILGSSAHHFAQQHFWTDGSNVYLEVKDKSDKLLQLLTIRTQSFASSLGTQVINGMHKNGFGSCNMAKSNSLVSPNGL